MFDEADALFSSKTNSIALLTAFLIQRLESYKSLAILTTNADQKIDPAFFRRAVNVINFPALNSQQRLNLFQKLFSQKGVQLDTKIDLAAITTSIQMTGRNISSIVNASIINAINDNPTTKPITISLTNFSNAIKQEMK
jgi:SpoVK/Ycf46/Vps4 family AAA+-type ATPase